MSILRALLYKMLDVIMSNLIYIEGTMSLCVYYVCLSVCLYPHNLGTGRAIVSKFSG